MKRRIRKPLNRTGLMVSLLGAMIAMPALAPQCSESAPAAMTVVESPMQVTFGPVPPQFMPGAQLAVLAGDPTKAGPYTIRLKMPAGYKVSPHWHPANVNVTVLTGTMGFGMGDKLDEHGGKLIQPGGFVVETKGMHHYVWAVGPTLIQAHGEGPLVINYINPSDDPSKTHH